MAKSYKDMTPKEKYDSAIEADKAEWSPGTEIRKLVRSKLGMDNENMAKGIELKTGKPSSEKPYELKPELKKKGGSVKSCGCKGECKCMKKSGSVKKYARGGGVEVRGKTKGRFC